MVSSFVIPTKEESVFVSFGGRSFVPQDDGNKFPVIRHGATIYDFPTEDDISRVISKDLKKRGMSFVGSTIIYAYLQAVGVVDDHIEGCFCKK